ASVDLGSALSIKDDAPTLSLGASKTPQAIQVDESFIGHAGASNSANFSSAFSASHNAGQDGELSFSSSYQLLTSDGTDSGLIDSDSGKHILLYTDPSGHVFGRVDGPSGDKALDISVDQNGVVSFSTLRAVQHPDSANPDEPKSLAPRSLVLQRTDTVVDKDGDSASGKASVDLGSALSIKDDAPTLQVNQGAIEQAAQAALSSTNTDSKVGLGDTSALLDLTNAFKSSQAFTKDAGEDGEKSTTLDYKLGFTNTTGSFDTTKHSIVVPTGSSSSASSFTVESRVENGQIIIQARIANLPLDPPTIRISLDTQGTIRIQISGGDKEFKIDGAEKSLRDIFFEALHNRGMTHLSDLLPQGTSLSLVGRMTLTDKDLDQATAAGHVEFGQLIQIDTSEPSRVAVNQQAVSSLSIFTDESYLTGGSDRRAPDQENKGLNTIAQGNIESLFNFNLKSGDTVTSQNFSIDITNRDPGLGGLTNDKGESLVFERDPNNGVWSLVNRQDHTEVYAKLTQVGNSIVFQLLKSVHQPNSGNTDEGVNLLAYGVTAKAEATLSNGQKISGQTNIGSQVGIEDDGPTISSIQPIGQHSTLTANAGLPHAQTTTGGASQTSIATSTIYHPNQNIGLVLDYSGSMFDSNPPRIDGQREGALSAIRQALQNAGYVISNSENSNGNIRNPSNWRISTDSDNNPATIDHPGDVHLAIARFATDISGPLYININSQMSTEEIKNKLVEAYNELYKEKGAGGIGTSTDHEDAWKAALKIANTWTGQPSSQPAGITAGHEVLTDSNLLIMTDGQTTKGNRIFATGSLSIGQVSHSETYSNHHTQHSNTIDGHSQITLSGDILDQGNHPIHFSVNANLDDIFGRGHTKEIVGDNGEVIGWLTHELIEKNKGGLIFVPNHAAGYHNIDSNSLKESGQSITSHIVDSKYTDQTDALQHELDSLNQIAHHSQPFLIGVGLIGNDHTLGADLHMTMGGSLPPGSHVETITDHQSGASLGQSIGQVVNQAIQVNHPPASYTWEFDFNPGVDSDPDKLHFELGFGRGGLGSLGSSSNNPIQAFSHLFGSQLTDGGDPSVKKDSNGVYSIHIANLGTFEVNLGSDYSTPGSHHASIRFTPDSGVDLANGIQGFNFKIVDGDNDLSQASFNIPATQGHDGQATAADSPVTEDPPETEDELATPADGIELTTTNINQGSSQENQDNSQPLDQNTGNYSSENSEF
ncbi:MAG: DUF5801 repeats-in-toxin domain-containing protein, partial [Candidatus Nanopelagicaceae bacterium]